MKKIIYLLIIVLFPKFGFSQDPIFSQFSNEKTNMINPAYVGLEKGKTSALLMLKSQWFGGGSSPYKSNYFAFTSNIKSNENQEDYFGYGIDTYTESSNNGLLKKSMLGFTGAYHNALNAEGTKLFSGAIGAAYTNRIIDPTKFSTQSQFGSGGFNANLPNYEPIAVPNNYFFDMHLGLHYQDMSHQNWGYQIGGALYHAFGSAESAYQTAGYYMGQRTVFNAQVYLGNLKGNYWTIQTQLLKQGQFSMNTIGFMYNRPIEQYKLKAAIGLFDRFNDAIYPYIEIMRDNWKISITYDIVTNKARTSFNSLQSAEVGLKWNFIKK